MLKEDTGKPLWHSNKNTKSEWTVSITARDETLSPPGMKAETGIFTVF